MDGFIVVDKPAGLSSHSAVGRVRRLTGEKKGGHTGTLDPFATGVLPVALGEATKSIQFLDESIKGYRAVLRLGCSTDTQDCTGAVLQEGPWQHLTGHDIEAVVREFTGHLLQTPPMFSALKRNGVPLYRLARKGVEVERVPREIEIISLAIDRIELPLVTISVSCSRGTYVRTLAHDIGQRLGCGAHLTELRRTRSGPFSLEAAVTLDLLQEMADQGRLDEFVMTISTALDHIPECGLTESAAGRLSHGIAPGREGLLRACPDTAGTSLRLVSGGRLLAVAETTTSAAGTLRLLRVFN
jgi:tRNA pseudouridine55 synthase